MLRAFENIGFLLCRRFKTSKSEWGSTRRCINPSQMALLTATCTSSSSLTWSRDEGTWISTASLVTSQERSCFSSCRWLPYLSYSSCSCSRVRELAVFELHSIRIVVHKIAEFRCETRWKSGLFPSPSPQATHTFYPIHYRLGLGKVFVFNTYHCPGVFECECYMCYEDSLSCEACRCQGRCVKFQH